MSQAAGSDGTREMACVSTGIFPRLLYISFIVKHQVEDLWALKLLMPRLKALIIALTAKRPY